GGATGGGRRCVRRRAPAVLLAAAGFVLAYAHTLNAYWMHVAIIAMFYGILAASWSLLAGYAGLFSLGHMAFASIGGYTSGLLVQWSGIPIPLSMAARGVLCFGPRGAIAWVVRRSHRLGLPANEWPLSCDFHPRVRGNRPYHLLDRGRRDCRHGGTAHPAAVRHRLSSAILLHGFCTPRAIAFVHGRYRPLALGT